MRADAKRHCRDDRVAVSVVKMPAWSNSLLQEPGKFLHFHLANFFGLTYCLSS